MNPSDFTLQHSDVVQPKLLDGDCATRDWPLPPVKPYTPAPRDTTQLPEWGQRLERWAQRRLAA